MDKYKIRIDWTIISIIACVGLFLYCLSMVWIPFFLGSLIAYTSEPLVNYLAKRNIKRHYSATMIVLFITVIMAYILTQALPVIYKQIIVICTKLPSELKYLNQYARDFLDQFVREGLIDDNKLMTYINSSTEGFFDMGANFAGQLIKGSAALANSFSILVLTPIVAFYCLKDWPKFIANINKNLPTKYSKIIKDEFKNVNSRLRGFLKGQTIVSLILCVYYVASLSLAGLNEAVSLGIFTGVMVFLPYLGAFLGMILSIGMAIVQLGFSFKIISIVLGVFTVGQFIEGNFLTPRFVGDQIGLHPLWILFALLVGGNLYGVWGLFLALPLGAIIGVLLRFLLRIYRERFVLNGFSNRPKSANQ